MAHHACRLRVTFQGAQQHVLVLTGREKDRKLSQEFWSFGEDLPPKRHLITPRDEEKEAEIGNPRFH